MPYIMEDVNVLKNGNKINTYTFLVKNNKISYMKETNLPFEKHIRMNLSSYILTPGHVMIDMEMEDRSFLQFKSYLSSVFISRGCTTLISVFSIQHEHEFLPAIKKARAKLLNCPIDYFLALQIPLTRLTPSIVRKCKRQRIPAVFVKVDDANDIEKHAWGWIKEALYQFPVTFIPIFKDNKKAKFMKKNWTSVLDELNMVHLTECPTPHHPLSLDTLMKLGIYPSKGDIRIGGELDYNLYFCREGSILEAVQELDYDSQQPEITIHRGKIIKAGEKVYFQPGFGNECKVTVPGHFQLQ